MTALDSPADPAPRRPDRRPVGLVGRLVRPGPDAARRLRRMKTVATAILVLSAALYAVSFALRGAAALFLRAGTEGAMVGALADWFAVTALFRHPLGLPIPHTGLIPRQKDAIAAKLGGFVTEHFLTADALVREVTDADLVGRLGATLRAARTADRLARDGAYTAAVLLAALDDSSVVAYVLELLRRDAARRSYAPVLGRALDRAVANDAQVPLVQVLLRGARTYLETHRDDVVGRALRVVDHVVPWWAGLAKPGPDKLRGWLTDVTALLRAAETDPQHRLRQELDSYLATLVAALVSDPGTIAAVDAAVARLLADPRSAEVLRELVTDGKRSVAESLADPSGVLQAQISAMVQTLGRRLADDDTLRRRVHAAATGVIAHLVEQYGSTLTTLIRRKVGEWDARDASRNIELAVGRDLQFIRINGTVVGGLAGLTIHGLTVAFT